MAGQIDLHQPTIGKEVQVGRVQSTGKALHDRTRIELQQSGVASHQATRKGRPRQGLEPILLQGLELARGKLEQLRDIGD